MAATTTTRSTAAAAPPILLLLLVLIITMSAAAAVVQAADTTAETTTTHLSFFMHDITSGTTSPTAVKVINGPGTTPTAPTLGMTFGDTTVFDDPLTTTSSPSSPELGRMQGIYMLASQSGAALMVCANLLLTSGAHNGSTLAVLGRDDAGLAAGSEIPVVGGTGTLRMASGYVVWKTPEGMNGTDDATVQLDVYVTTDGGGGGDALAPAPAGGADAAGGGGSSSSGGSKSSSGAAARRMAGGGGGGWVVAVVVAVVGSSWVW